MLWVLLLLIQFVQAVDLAVKSWAVYCLFDKDFNRINQLFEDGEPAQITFLIVYLLRPALVTVIAFAQCFYRSWRRPAIFTTMSKIVQASILAYNIDGANKNEGGLTNVLFGFVGYLVLTSLPL